jgi:hypothetical protein
MLKNTISNKWIETIDKAAETSELIIFDIGEVSFGIPMNKIDRVINKATFDENFQVGQDIEILDLHHRLFEISISNPTEMAIFKGDKLYAIPIDTIPTLVEVPLDRIRIIPTEFRTNNPLGIASHIAMISTPTAELTIFILGS